jgi:hypothetical protein
LPPDLQDDLAFDIHSENWLTFGAWKFDGDAADMAVNPKIQPQDLTEEEAFELAPE